MLYGNRVFLYFFFGKVFLGGQQFREAYDGIQWYTDLVSDIFQKILFQFICCFCRLYTSPSPRD